jgi:hypothetical protein
MLFLTSDFGLNSIRSSHHALDGKPVGRLTMITIANIAKDKRTP